MSRSGGTVICHPGKFCGWMVPRPGAADATDVLLV